jgi:hypothetical protein
VAIAVGTEAPPKDRRSTAKKGTLQPVWNEVFDVTVPAEEDHLLFPVFESELIGKDESLGVASLDIRGPLRYNGAFVLPLRPRAFDPTNAETSYKDHGLGRLHVRTEWLDLPPYRGPDPEPTPPPTIPHTPAGQSPGAALQNPQSTSTLDLQIVEGRGLCKRDLLGEGDPYVQACWGTDPNPFFTTQVSEGASPYWDEGVKGVKVPPAVEYLTLLVWDKDRGSSDDFLGVHRLRLLPAPWGEFWVWLYPRENEPADKKLLKKAKGNLGEIKVRVHYRHVQGYGGPLGGPKVATPLSPPPMTVPTRLRLIVLGAQDLAPADSNGLSDPYVTIAVGTEIAPEDRQTLAQKKTLNPTWDEQFDFTVPVSADHLTFNVLDKDLIGKGDFLGQAVLDVRFPLRANGTYTLPLMPRANEAKDF